MSGVRVRGRVTFALIVRGEIYGMAERQSRPYASQTSIYCLGIRCEKHAEHTYR
jgi:hypothetical protein